MYIFEPPSKNGGREKRLYYLLRSRGEILLHFSFSFHTRGQDEDFYSIFSYRCLEIFAFPLEIRSLFVRINLSFLVPFLSRGRRRREGREGRSFQHTGTGSRVREIVRSGREGREIGRSNRADVNCVYLLASSLGKVSLPRLISDETAQSRGEALFPHQRDQATVRQLRLDRRRFVLARVAALLMMTSAAPRALLLPRVLLLLQRLLLGT